MKTVIEMALQAGIFHEYDSEGQWDGLTNDALIGADYLTDKEHKLKRISEILTPFAELVRADERKACAKKTEEFARKWWKIHCDSNLHYSSTLRAHQDFCALQAAIRARNNT